MPSQAGGRADPWPRARRLRAAVRARAVGRAASARRTLAGTPLWARLVAGSLLLVALALALTAGVGIRLLAGYMVDRVDAQLAAATEVMRLRPVPLGPLTRRPHEPESRVFGQYYAAVLDESGRVVRVASPAIGYPGEPMLPRLGRPDVRMRLGEPFTVESVAGGAPWRMVAHPLRGGGTLVLAISLHEVESTVARLRFIDTVVGVCVLAALGAAGYGLVRASLRPLAEIEQTAHAIAGGDLSRRVPARDPRTELGRLGRSLNGMLSQIELAFRARERSEAAARRSEERMRRFVADASHELRTPLTSIRGFAELYRQEGGDDAAEAARLLRRIEDEGARMGLLVDDLLLLARLDQQRPLDVGPVDLLAIAADAVIDARALAPDRMIDLVRPDGAEGPLVVPGDEERLRQVVRNLVNNALTHTPAGTPVRVGLGTAERGGERRAVVEVIDEGPGMAETDAQRVFERFYRVDPSRSRAQGGAGLGLSIVAALAEAHGGAIELDTAPGQGARFRVLLPVRAGSGDG